MKRILDSVHGYIYLDDHLVQKFVDTGYFQRLRRIEQTSIRAVFPSARHDRFIHSLGVYALGNKIVEKIKEKGKDFGYDSDEHDKFFNSYLIACLMHDCAHTPFSHTFEIYFKHNDDELPKILKGELQEPESFEQDRFKENGDEFGIAPHEYLSAILCLKKFRNAITDFQAIPDLVARMIVGIQYKNGHSFENCLISLIHGDTIDADRLDYVCRDRWASGYSTSTIDVIRLIDSIHIKRKEDGAYCICYDSAALHDIEGVLSVKAFQQEYVLTHHTVCYEQFLLQKAMEHTAYRLLNNGENSEDEDAVTGALKKLCKPDVMWDGIHQYGLDVDFLSDDDFVVMMKRYMDDTYVKQWFSRQYTMKPLWKSIVDYNSLFFSKNENMDEYNSVYKKSEPYKLAEQFKGDLTREDFLRVDAELKRVNIPNDMLIMTKQGELKPYEELFGKQGANSKILFFYLYLSDKAMKQKDTIIEYLRS